MRDVYLSREAMWTVLDGGFYLTEKWAYQKGKCTDTVYRIPTDRFFQEGARFRYEGSEAVRLRARSC